MADTIQIRRDTAANWASVNPVLAQGEMGLETDTERMKLGDGVTAYNSLNYFVTSQTNVGITGGTIDGTVIGGSSAAAITGTTITGTSFVSSGDMTFGDNDKAVFGAGSDLQIWHAGDASYIGEVGTGNLIIYGDTNIDIQNAAGQKTFRGESGGPAYLYHANNLKLNTTSTGIDVTGVITTDGMTTSADINFGDNDKAVFGAGSDLQIYHDGSNSYVQDAGDGALILNTTNGGGVYVYSAGETMATFNSNGAVNLYYDNAAKLATTATGIDVTGTVTADSASVTGDAYVQTADGASAFYVTRYGTIISESAKFHIDDNDLIIDSIQDEQFGGFTFKSTLSGTGTRNRLDIANNGDISFYEDTGTTAKLFWDASAESLGIGTASPAAPIEVQSSVSGNYVARFQNTNALTPYGVWVREPASAANGYPSLTVTDNAGTSTRFRVDSGTGNVGIGTSSPSAPLHVSGSSTNYVLSETTGTGTSSGFRLKGDASADFTLFTTQGTNQFAIYDNANSAERMRIDSSGNLLLNTTNSPTTTRAIISSDYSAVGTTNTGLSIAGRSSGNWYNNGIHALGTALAFSTGTTGTTGADATNERMRITSAGDLLVGTTSTATNDVGFKVFQSTGQTVTTASGTNPVLFNRKTSDGDIAIFRKDDVTVGSLGTVGGALVVGSGDTGLLFDGSGDYITPRNASTQAGRDAAIDLGTSSDRFKDLYLSGGVYLGGTGAANQLDDYEEGTFTPTITSGTVTYTAQRGRYTKIGRVVYIHAFVQVASISGSSGTAIISGLPFVAKNDSNYSALASKTNGFNWGGSATMITFQVIPNTAVIGAVGSGNNIAFNDVDSSGLAASDWIACTGHYVTDS